MDDLDLINNILDGDERSFEILFFRYEKEISKYIYTNIKDVEATKDIVQEVFISIYNKLFTFKLQNKFKPWLYAIARNKTIDYIRQNKKVVFVDIDNKNLKIKEQGNNIDCRMEFKETKHSIENFIKNLNFKDRDLLYLKYHNQDMTFKQLAEILNISEAAVKSRYYLLHKKYISYVKKEKLLGGKNIEV